MKQCLLLVLFSAMSLLLFGQNNLQNTSLANSAACISVTASSTDISCNGLSDGTATTVVAGGTAPYGYSWSSGATTASLTGLNAGVYTVTVNDSGTGGTTLDTLYQEGFEGVHNWTLNVSTGTNGINSNTWFVSDDEGGVLPPGCGIATNGNKTLHMSATSIDLGAPLGCFALSGLGAAYNASGLSCGAGGCCVITDQRAESPVFTTVGYNNASVSFDYIGGGEGLDDNASMYYNDGTGWTLLVPSLKSAICGSGQGLWTAFNIALPASCFNNPTVQVAFRWVNDGDNVGTDPSFAVNDIVVTSNGTGGALCSDIQSVTITAPSAISVTAVTVDPSCGGTSGTIDLTVTGGTATYTYLWSNAATTEDLSGLSGGTYIVTTTDANSCTETTTITLGSGSATTIAVDTVINVLCNGSSTGEIQITASDSSSCSSPIVVLNEIMYRPSTSNGVDPNTGEYIELIGPPGANIGCYVLTDGDWTITIPPGTTIPADGLFTIGNNIIWGPGFFDLDAENCGCFTEGTGGSALLILTDSGEYLAMFDGTGTFIDGLVYGSPTVGTNDPPNGANATAGVISTVGTAGCVASVTIPGAASFQTTVAGVAANTSLIRSPDGSGAWSTQTGGSPNACNTTAVSNLTYIWSNGATTDDISGLAAGTYTVTVSDGGGCDGVQSFTVTEPSAITVTTDAINDATCLVPGSVLVSIAGGTAGYSFLWSNGATSEDITGLSAGTYNVTVTDANGCEMAGASYVVNSVGVPIITVDNITTPICFGATAGSIDVSGSGGTAAYSYAWSNGQNTATATGLGAGVYTVTLTDNVGCTVSQSITVTEPAQIVASVTTTNATCVNNDATATPNVSGGTGVYTYQWSNGETTQNLSNLPGPGNISVTVTDVNGCVGSSLGNLIGLDTTLTLSGTSSNLDCSGDSTGAISLTAANGGLPYSYLWSNGASSDTLAALGAGTYTVTVTDASGCTMTDSYTITLPLLPTVNAFIGQTGIIDSTIILGETININAGNDQTGQGVSYEWTANPTDANFGNSIAVATTVNPGTDGIYTFTVIATSLDGCMDTSLVSLTVETLDDPQVPTAFTPNNDNNNDTFQVVYLDSQDVIDFTIYNRWGQIVFNNAAGTAAWDGTFGGVEQASDSYIYIISYQRPNDLEPTVLRGNVTLLR